MADDSDGARFLAAYNALRAMVDDDPSKLDENDSYEVLNLCDQLDQLIRRFDIAEEWSALAFTEHVSAAGAKARRDYDARWREHVWRVANRSFLALFDDLIGDLIDDAKSVNEADPSPADDLGQKILGWKAEARDEAQSIGQLIDYVSDTAENDDFGYFEWAEESLSAWDRLRLSGLDIAGTLWRRRALPHVLVPSHVANHYGSTKRSLLRRLHQAGRAFVFGAPLAALALQRAVSEEVLTKHWGAERGEVRDAKLPSLALDLKASRLKRVANQVLHGDPETLSAEEQDRLIIENFLLLRLLIEEAPEDLAAHRKSLK